MFFKSFCITCVFLLLTACATPVTRTPEGSKKEIKAEEKLQFDMAFERMLAENQRVLDLAWPILNVNADLCEETSLQTGMEIWTKHSLPQHYQGPAKRLYDLGDTPQIMLVSKNSPADKVGLMRGDKILDVNGQKIPPGKKAGPAYGRIIEARTSPELEFGILRYGQPMAVRVRSESACDYGIIYDPYEVNVNAFADGYNIHIPRGMIRFADNDTELALVIGHEIAHNAMQHQDKKMMNAVTAGLFGLMVEGMIYAGGGAPDGDLTNTAMALGYRTHSIDFEHEADYVGMYMMARAGYDTSSAANFWRRMASEYKDGAIKERRGNTHPTSAKRFIALDKTHQEIQEKRRRYLKLWPELDPELSERALIRTAAEMRRKY